MCPQKAKDSDERGNSRLLTRRHLVSGSEDGCACVEGGGDGWYPGSLGEERISGPSRLRLCFSHEGKRFVGWKNRCLMVLRGPHLLQTLET